MDKPKSIRVALADDHTVFRDGMKLLINGYKGIELIFEAAHGTELMKKLAGDKVDVILLDLSMPEMDGLRAIPQIQKNYPKIKIIALSLYKEKKIIIETIKRGANGYLVKDAASDEVEEAIREVMEKGFYRNELLNDALYKGWGGQKRVKLDLAKDGLLTKQEVRVLKLICMQLTTPQIGEKMNLSPKTIDNYRVKIMQKIGAKNVVGMVIYAMERGLVNLDLSRWKD